MKEIFAGKITRFVILSFIFVTVSCCLYSIPNRDYTWFYIIWNCFLAVVPLYFSLFAKYYLKNDKKVKGIISGLIWLLFFPNTIYMLTDLKYLSNFSGEIWDNYETLSFNVIQWLFMGNVIISVTCGVLFGMLSLYIMHTMFIKIFGRFKCALGVIVVMLLSSFGIYIGRFPRLNSWDVVRPAFLIETALSSITEFTEFFILFFTILSLVIYILFYMLVKICIENSKSAVD